MIGAGMNPKRAVRAEVRRQRAARSRAEQELASAQLSRHLISLVTEVGAARVTCYLATPGEPDPGAFLDWALRSDIEVLLPISLPEHTLAWAAHRGEEPALGRHGIREPTGTRLPAAAAGTTDLLFIPACAVDASGTRLGWGLGYYDRCLAGLDPAPPVYALVFDEEFVGELPRDAHDIPVAGVVTPSAIRRFPTQTR